MILPDETKETPPASRPSDEAGRADKALEPPRPPPFGEKEREEVRRRARRERGGPALVDPRDLTAPLRDR